MFTAYLDESRQDKAGVFVVAGYVFSRSACARFEKQWRHALDSAQLPRFHMSEWESRKGPYSAWNDKYRHQFYNRLMTIIHRNVRLQVATVVNLNDLATISSDEREELLGDTTEYSLGSINFVAQVREAIGSSESVAYVYDLASAKVGKTRIDRDFRRMLRRGDIGPESTITWADSVSHPQLQAADILAYEYAKQYTRTIGYETRPPRKSGHLLVRGLSADRVRERIVDSESLQEVIGVLRRASKEFDEQRGHLESKYRSPEIGPPVARPQ